jgi:hypothetical protein
MPVTSKIWCGERSIRAISLNVQVWEMLTGVPLKALAEDNPGDLLGFTAPCAWQPKLDLALVLKDIEMSPDHLLGLVVTTRTPPRPPSPGLRSTSV